MTKNDITEMGLATAASPSEYLIHHKSTHACAVLSIFLNDMGFKLLERSTPEQDRKFKELLQAYRDIVSDCSHVNRLEYLVGRYQDINNELKNENNRLKKENEKLLKTLEFSNETPNTPF